MSVKTKKIDREFLITDSSVNCYGFRLLTSGYLLDEYKRNPIGYYNHIREDGVLVRWEDLRVDGDKVYGKPVVNLSNERGQQTVDEMENGFLNGASVGHIVALEWSEDPKDMIPGQTGPTITKWYNREASPCDIPGNYNALALDAVGLFDKDGVAINLSDFKTTTNQKLNMEKIFLTPEQLKKIGLADNAKQDDVNAKIENLAAEAAKVPQLTQDLATANAAKDKAVNDLAEFKKSNIKSKINDLVDAAVNEKKCTKEMGEILKTQFENKPVELKALLDAMKPYAPVTTKVLTSDNPAVLKLMEKSGEELWRTGDLSKLKALDKEAYKVKYEEAFGEKPEDEA